MQDMSPKEFKHRKPRIPHIDRLILISYHFMIIQIPLLNGNWYKFNIYFN